MTNRKDETRPQVQIRNDLLPDSVLDFVHCVTRTYYYSDPWLLIALDVLSLQFRVAERGTKGRENRSYE